MNRKIVSTSMMVNRNDEEIELQIDGYVEFEHDYRWGEDADGHYGVGRTFVEDVVDVEAYDALYGNDFDLTVEEHEQAKRLLAEEFLMG